ncbi:nuclease-related domain-containing DEAD/DEAH box helicase [Arcobacter cloacae]|uniref:DNA 3'-5' helicase II n=1 Tax=Arcobacter cloacae TaxID=1054034 RepID=A0A6M8NWK7_9BACT|nr:NERD domain-containing protein [Arcobacter cloacae]QKF91146.1 DUF2075 domain-containing protein [Arcobacter cloacae]RXI40481.1 hypothetical protein CP963_08810 [Arcobacter cloacae]
MKSILKLFSKISKGNLGEEQVLETMINLLKNGSNESNFFIIPKVQIADLAASKEIDIVLLHPLYGLYIIEVKNWNKLIITEENNPFNQAKEYKNLLLSKIKDEFGKVAINIEYRVVFPTISTQEAKEFFLENKNLEAYKNHAFFKEDLISKENFKRFFNSSFSVIPNKKEFLKIASLIVDKEKIKNNENKILPIISQDEVIYFDYTQLSVLNGYNGDFKIIRGVAGTGKTIILSHFVNNKLNTGVAENFLILCFNKKLVENLNNIFIDNEHKNNIKISSLFSFLNFINFDYEKVGILDKKDFQKIYENFETDVSLDEFRTKLKIFLQKNPIDYFICDETQDMPAGFMRIIYEEIKDCIFFIDEAQKFYTYSMNDISNIFNHPKFEKIDMRGKVKNLKNVYRTPSNIAKCAFEILSNDEKLNKYYKRSAFYLKNDFLTDINFVLEDGNIILDNWNNFQDLKTLLEKQTQDTIVLTYTTKQVEAITNIIKSINKDEIIKAMTIQSVKGLEAQNIIIHNFDMFLNQSLKYEKDIFYRKLYVLLTRAQKNLYISYDEKILNDEISKNVIKIIEKNQSLFKEEIAEEKEHKLVNLTKLKPTKEQVKTTGEFIVLGAELFAVIGGLFS